MKKRKTRRQTNAHSLQLSVGDLIMNDTKSICMDSTSPVKLSRMWWLQVQSSLSLPPALNIITINPYKNIIFDSWAMTIDYFYFYLLHNVPILSKNNLHDNNYIHNFIEGPDAISQQSVQTILLLLTKKMHITCCRSSSQSLSFSPLAGSDAGN